MKKKLLAALIGGTLLIGGLTGCGNQAVFDTTWTFNRAIIELGNGEVKEGVVKTWQDYEGEQIQITFEDGSTYLVSSVNCTLIHDAK